MDFLGIGYQEILLVFLLMLVFVGPERMPRVAYQMGRAVREMQKYARSVRDEFSEEIGFLETQYREVEAEMKQAQSSIRAETATFDRELRSATASVGAAVKEVTTDLNAPAAAGGSKIVPLSAAKPGDATPVATPGADGSTAAAPEQESGPAAPPAITGPAAAETPKPSEAGKKLVF